MIFDNFKKYFSIIIFFVLPIIIANQYYVDDLGRSTQGYALWGMDGRPFADILMYIFNMSLRMSDLAPLPLIASSAILAFVLSKYRIEFFGSCKYGFIVPLSFFANPALISVFSYRFDVLTFTFAIGCSFLIFVLNIKNKVIEFIWGVMLVCLVMGTYQAIINLVAILIICEIFKSINKNKKAFDIFICTIKRALQVIFGALIYLKIVLPLSFSGGHSAHHPEIANNIFDVIASNAKDYFNFVSATFFRSNATNIILSSSVLCIILAFIIIFNYKRNNNSGIYFYIVSIISIVSSALALPLTMGGLLFLSNSMAGAVHLYMSVSGYMLLLATLLYYSSGHYKAITIISVIPLMYVCGLMYSYGNALKSQDFVNKQIAYEIKLATTGYNYNTKYIVFNGTPPRSQVVKNSIINYPIIDVSVMNYFYNWYWAISNLSMNGLKQLYPSAEVTSKSISSICHSEMIYSNQDFNVYKHGDVIVIDFDKIDCRNNK